MYPSAFPLATTTLAFYTGVAFGVLLLIVGLWTGLAVSRRLARTPAPDAVPPEQLMSMLRGLSTWTNGMASEVSDYRTEVEQLVAQLQTQIDSTREPGNADGPDDAARREALLDQIMQANEALRERLDAAEATLQHQAEELSGYVSEARTDSLTGLPNRRTFDDELERRLAEWHRHGTTVSLVMLDVDHFKKFNDLHGHLAGDAVLRDVAQVLRETLRTTDLPARYGGEEFGVIIPNGTHQSTCQTAERLREAVAQATFAFEDQQLQVTVSCGCAVARKGERAAHLIKRADAALYESKRAGRNAVSFHDGQQCLTTRQLADSPDAAGGREFHDVCSSLRARLEEVLHG